MATHYINLRGLDAVEIENFQPGDTVVVIREKVDPVNSGWILIDELEPVETIKPTPQQNRGPGTGIEAWKRRGRK